MSKSEIARQCYRAYETKDRKLLESLLADDFVFSSPRDDYIDRATYMARCWANSGNIRNFTFEYVAEQGDEVVVRYLVELTDGTSFRNMETLRFSGDKLRSADVYFGRTVERDQPSCR
ncbi:nuclear transport factor 2 family protein [Bradyrhizobium sp. LHD-71]|uniref:nuclear transport factor 2 family protein n=1 Tax=Bradyrhizobium sp. LHD-71 TaxID=3072141 RepID=UPI00280EFE86|nr:nuclear transport factor 2 family protein [Bradyrhizobium sp. LHD-71]MDQ8730605.1 nuclear transport factor 2 family protein [Bradyrhizobium sp. LHD-71]